MFNNWKLFKTVPGFNCPDQLSAICELVQVVENNSEEDTLHAVCDISCTHIDLAFIHISCHSDDVSTPSVDVHSL